MGGVEFCFGPFSVGSGALCMLYIFFSMEFFPLYKIKKFNIRRAKTVHDKQSDKVN